MNLLKTETWRRSENREVSFPLVKSQTTGTNSDSSTEKFRRKPRFTAKSSARTETVFSTEKNCWPSVELIYRVFAAPLFATFTIKCYDLRWKAPESAVNRSRRRRSAHRPWLKDNWTNSFYRCFIKQKCDNPFDRQDVANKFHSPVQQQQQ